MYLLEVLQLIQFRLKEALKKRGMTMSELSQRTGISRATLSTLASGKTQGIQFSTLEKIAGVLHLTNTYGVNGLFSVIPDYSSPIIKAFALYNDIAISKQYSILVERNLFKEKVNDVCNFQLDFIPNKINFPTEYQININFFYAFSGTHGNYSQETSPFSIYSDINTNPNNLETYRVELLSNQDSVLALGNQVIQKVLPKIELPTDIWKKITKIKMSDRKFLFSLNKETFKKVTGQDMLDSYDTSSRRQITESLDSSYAMLTYDCEIDSSFRKNISNYVFKLKSAETEHDFVTSEVSSISKNNVFYL
ncbi:helix-turn-helix domain-containing protein [Levilactobacillus brevis]|uniref:helix-turn-helix domain-containing protein n=1 Tax=Levilactobacillus brevis TaxID=1580 RepID=UPI001CDAF192|nr:helix-turn-helix transcriptional regulator [Levilactobacillus brevis]